MNPLTILRPVWQKKKEKTLSPILVPACQHITGEWVSHVTSGLHCCVGQARCKGTEGRTERRTEEKVMGRWKGEQRRGGSRGRGEEGAIISSPHVFIFSPLLSLAPTHSSHSITQAPRTARGPGRAFASRQTQPDMRLKATLITVSVCGSTATLKGARRERDKRERKRLRGRITAKFAHYQKKETLCSRHNADIASV